MTRWFDTHAHYNDERFEDPEICPNGVDAFLDELFETSVSGIVNAASDLETSRSGLALAHRHKGMYAGVGIHPHECEKSGDMEAALSAVEALLADEKAVAIGEIGLDYHYDFSPREMQKEWFAAQMSLAEKTGYPVIIHNRESTGDCVEILRRFPGVRGIIHSCSCSAETVRELVAMGYYISFSGSVTFKNAENLRRAAEAVPSDRLLIETDCPYLAPVPYRGRCNHSGYLSATAAVLAEVRGTDPETLAALTERNAHAIFRI